MVHSLAWAVLPYIKLFTRHVFSGNSTLKQCIKSTRINISRNHSKSLNLPDLQETVSNLCECIFSRLWYSRKQSGKWMHAEKNLYTVFQTSRCLCLAVSVGWWRMLPGQRSLRWTCHKGQAGVKGYSVSSLNLAEFRPWDAIVLRRMSTNKQSINQSILYSLFSLYHTLWQKNK